MSELQQNFFTWLRAVRSYAPALRVIFAVCLVACGIFGARLLRRFAKRMQRHTTRHTPEWLDIVTLGFQEPFVLLLRVICWYLAVYALPLPGEYAIGVYKLANTALRLALLGLVVLGLWNSSGVCKLLLRSAQNRLDLESSKTMLQFFEKFYRALILVFGAIAALNELGFNVNALITGAGLVGLTLSLAAQSTVSNLVAGIALVLERPFGIGDYVTIGAVSGTVKDISFRTTSICTPDNAIVSIENANVCKEAIQNVAGRDSRRWDFTIGVTYQTTRAQLVSLCAALESCLKSDPDILPDTVEVNLTDFAASALSVRVICYVKAVDILPFHALQNRLNLRIMQVMEAEGCSFAYPSTSVYLEKPAP
ncbi:MAG: mechanosensitive ion channel family protein [Gemmiger sp.]|nr:mechanosensitive ion channel family protein [Gemmiger sp.]